MRKTVAVGEKGNGPVPVMRAAYREGFGCIVMGAEQTSDDVDKLPVMKTPALSGDPSKIPWPNGDLVAAKPLHR